MVYISYVCMYVSVFLITVMSVERYLAVRYPFKMLHWKKSNAMNLILAVGWTLALLLGLPAIWTQSLEENMDGVQHCFSSEFGSVALEVFFACSETLIGFIIPFVTLAVCYVQVASQLRQMHRKRKQKSVFLISGVVLAFALCWLPHHVMNIINVAMLLGAHAENQAEVSEAAVFISGAMAFISSSVNPLLYAFAARSFQGSLRESSMARLFQEIASYTAQLRGTEHQTSHCLDQDALKIEVLEQPQETGMETVFVGACIIMAVCFVVGTPGNLLVIWTIVKHVKQCSHTVLLIKHLAVADLLVVFTLPLWIYSLAWSWVFSEVMCKAMVYIIYACMYASIFLITIMSVERFLAVRFPFTSVTWRKKQMLNKILLVVWVASFLLSIPVIITQTLDEHNGQMQCLFREYESNTQEAVLLLLETLVGFVIPFFILVLCYGCLYSRITEMSFRSKRKSTLLIASVVVVFALCWIPHHITNLLSLVQLVEVRENIKDVIDAMYMISSSLVFVSSTINPVLYVFAARSFRTSLRD
ncbi:hypothetical protein HF521_014055, partial [Silurus meridionalis]